jgi:uncharacterized protein YjdB
VDATIKKVMWSSSDEQIATVNEKGLVDAVANGDVKIIAEATDGSGEADTVTIAVSGQMIPVTGVGIISLVDTITVGESITLIAEISPDSATIQSVTWSIDNTDIATIDTTSRLLTGIAPGEVTVTVTTEDGNKTASKRIVVVAVTSVIAFADEQIICYPNPSSGLLIVEKKEVANNADFVISIYDLRGSSIYEDQSEEDKMIIRLQNGIYLIKISDGLKESIHHIIVY